MAFFAGCSYLGFLLMLNFIEHFFNLPLAQPLLPSLADSIFAPQEEACRQLVPAPRF